VKGDGITKKKATLPSVDRPDVKPPAPPPAAPAPTVAAAVKPRLQARRGGYDKGDGITTKKASLPSETSPLPAPVAEPLPKNTIPLNQLLRTASTPSLKAQATVTAAATSTSAPKTPDVPPRYDPLTPENKSEFQAAFLQGLMKNEDWAVALDQKRREESGKIGTQVKQDLGLKDVSKEPARTKYLTEFDRRLQEKADALEPWAVASRAYTAPPPEDRPRLDPKDPTGFQGHLLEAIGNKEPWALADEYFLPGQFIMNGIEKSATGFNEIAYGKWDDIRTKPIGQWGVAEWQHVLGSDALAKAKQSGAPWAFELEAVGQSRLERLSQDAATRLLKTDFQVGPPETLTSDEAKNEKKGARPDGFPPLAEDGSLKVPSPPEDGVTGYLRTNPGVEMLRESSQANIYNPQYLQYLGAALQASGGDTGSPPPAGKGYLAVTEHGFGYCWDPDKSPEENKKVSELSLKTGMTFDACGDVDADDALKKFASFDPTKPGKSGEVQIVLENNSHGKHKLSIKSDENGNVTTSYYFRKSTQEKWLDGIDQYGVTVVATVLKVAAVFYPPLAAAATVAGIASSAQKVYRAVQNDDWMGAALGAASLAGSLGKTGWFSEETSSTLKVVGQVGDALKTIKSVEAAFSSGQPLAYVQGLAQAVGMAASIGGKLAPEYADAFDKIMKYADRTSLAVAFGKEGYAALQKGDYATALGCAIDAMRSVKGEYQLPAGVTSSWGVISAALRGAGAALDKKDYAGAVNAVLVGLDKLYPGAPDNVMAAGIALTGALSKLKQDDPKGAAEVAGKFLFELMQKHVDLEGKLKTETDPEKRTFLSNLIDGVKGLIDKFGGAQKLFESVSNVVTAIKNKDPDAIIRESTQLVDKLVNNGYVHAADSVLRAASNVVQVIRSGGSFDAIAMAGQQLAQALQHANDLVNPALPTKPVNGDLTPGKPPVADPSKPGNPYGIGDTAPPDATSTTLRAGEALPDVAERLLGDRSRWPELFEYNRGLDPNLSQDPNALAVGTELYAPPEGYRVPDARRADLLAQLQPPPPPSHSVLSRGDSGNPVEVARLQQDLRWLGFQVKVDGAFGPQTEQAVKAFQQQAGLPVTGKVDAATWKALDAKVQELPQAHTGAPVGPGDKGPAVEELQQLLDKNAGEQLDVDGLYGNSTRDAVARFQKAAGLPETGKMDSATWAALRTAQKAPPPAPAFQTLKQGATGPYVYEVQRLLNDKLLAGVAVDGKFGPETATAVRAFQRNAGLSPTGEVDQKTLDALRAAPSAEPVTPGKEPRLGPGDKGPEVEALQRMLKAKFGVPEPTGVYDQATQTVVKSLQQRAGLNPTGAMDAASWSALRAMPVPATPNELAKLRTDLGEVTTSEGSARAEFEKARNTFTPEARAEIDFHLDEAEGKLAEAKQALDRGDAAKARQAIAGAKAELGKAKAAMADPANAEKPKTAAELRSWLRDSNEYVGLLKDHLGSVAWAFGGAAGPLGTDLMHAEADLIAAKAKLEAGDTAKAEALMRQADDLMNGVYDKLANPPKWTAGGMAPASFIQKFTSAATQHAKDVGWSSVSWWNQLESWVGEAQGCEKWQSWVMSWLGANTNDGNVDNDGIKFGRAHLDWGLVNHEVVWVMFPDGTKFVLDPWSNPEKPVVDYDAYVKGKGNLMDGAMGSLSELWTRYFNRNIPPPPPGRH